MKKLLILGTALILAACANVDITKTSSGFYDPTDPNLVEILKTRPERSYEELGTLTVTGFDSAETAKMHNAIRAKAAPLGSNAVIITEEGMVPGGWGTFKRWATGVAVRYKDAKK
ncbi:MAG: hypothetical protein AB7S81_03800 [Bdellovibrionales bacterium]